MSQQEQTETTPSGQPAMDDPVTLHVRVGPTATSLLEAHPKDGAYLIAEAIERVVNNRTDLIANPNDEPPERIHDWGALGDGDDYRPRVEQAVVDDLESLVECNYAVDRSEAIRRALRSHLSIGGEA